MNISRGLFSKNRALFSILKKGRGEPPPTSSSYAPLEAIFLPLNLKPDYEFMTYIMPQVFFKTSHSLRNVLDCTEFKLQQPSNHDLNTLTFLNYKNTHTGKAMVGISPNGVRLIFIESYPGLIPDLDTLEKRVLISCIE